MQEKFPSLIVNYLYSVSYQLLAILIPLISTPYISRVLLAEGVGAFGFTSTITTYFSLFGILGLNLYGQIQLTQLRDGDKEKFSQTFWEIFVAKTLTMTISILCYVAFIFIYGEYQLLLGILVLMLFSDMFDISWLYQGMENFKKITFRNYITRIASLILMLLFVRSEEDIYIYALIAQGGNLLGNFLLWIGIKKYISRPTVSWKNIFHHLRKCVVYFLPSLSTSIIASADIVMIGAIVKSDIQTGLYVQAEKIEQVVITVVTALSNVLLPRITYLFEEKEEKKLNSYIQQGLRMTGFLAVPMACGLFAIANVMVPVFLGDDFIGSVGLVQLFSIVLIFSGINIFMGNNCLIAQKKMKGYNISVYLGAGMNILLNAVLIPMFQCYGAVAASLLSEVIILMCFLHFAHKDYLSLKNIFCGWIKYFLAGILMGIVVWFMGQWLSCSVGTLLLLIVVGIALYIALVLIFRDQLVLYGLSRLKQIIKTGISNRKEE